MKKENKYYVEWKDCHNSFINSIDEKHIFILYKYTL